VKNVNENENDLSQVSIKKSDEMIVAPTRKANSFHQRLPGIENSCTITSEQAM
jgi:hypothetical protein